jgi:hypothetical protein
MALSAYDPKAPRRTYRGEEEWFELLDEVGHWTLRRAFIECGVSGAIAGNLVWFLEDQRRLDRHQGEGTRTKYRAILRDELDPSLVREAARAIPGYFNSRAA